MKAGWEVKALGDICEIVNGGTPKSAVPEYWGGEIQWLTPKDMGKLEGNYIAETPRKITDAGLSKCSAKLVPPNSLIMSTRAPIGHLAINAAPMAFNQGCRGMVPSDRVELKYLFYWMSANVPALNDLGTGATFKELGAGALKSFTIPLPPLEEQKQIVAVLDAAFEGLTRARTHIETNLQNARELFAALLLGFQQQGDTPWTESNLEDLVTDDCTLSYGIVQPGDETADGLPIVRPTDLGEREITLNGLKKVDPSKAAGYARTILQGGDLLLCVRGTTGTIGIAAAELAGANVTRGIVPVRFDAEKVLQRFGYYAFVSSPVQKQIEAATYGAALQQINIRDVRKLKFAYPNIAAQKQILDALDQAHNDAQVMQTHYRQKLQDLDDLRQSLLQKAFAGELT